MMCGLVATVATMLEHNRPRFKRRIAAPAADDPVEFLHALRSGGYPDVAADYLNALKNDPNAPKEILDNWDWEMSRTLPTLIPPYNTLASFTMPPTFEKTTSIS